MTDAQLQKFVLAVMCFVGFWVVLCLALSSRRTRFTFVLSPALFALSITFAMSAMLNPEHLRYQVAAALVPEMFFVLLLCWICWAQAGYLARYVGGTPMDVVVRRPLLRSVLKNAPTVLFSAWVLSGLLGMIWPSAAIQPYAAASVRFVAFKWTLMAAEMFYSALVAYVFLLATGSRVPVFHLKVKNLAFATGAFCWFLLAANASAAAGARYWVQDSETRQRLVETFILGEFWVSALSLFSFSAGLAIKYSPTLATALVERLPARWLPARDRFEYMTWRFAASGKARPITRVLYYVSRAGALLDLSEAEIRRVNSTLKLLAWMTDSSQSSSGSGYVMARELLDMQKEIAGNDVLASRLAWAEDSSSSLAEQRTDSTLLRGPLWAALDLRDPLAPEEEMPQWYYLAAVAAADSALVDASNVRQRLQNYTEFSAATDVYYSVKENP